MAGDMIGITFTKSVVGPHIEDGCGNCGMCGEYKHLDQHHKLMRSHGGTDEHLIGVCRECHNWIHANPAEARKKGYLISYYETDEYKKKYGVHSGSENDPGVESA